MKTIDFEKFASELTGKNIKVLKPENDKKYARYYPCQTIEPNQKYGIYFENMIQYDFKTTKNNDTFLKSFVSQHINKYEVKQYKGFENGQLVCYTKDEVIKKYIEKNRVNKFFYYTTLYGIGMFAFFTKDIKQANVKITKYLEAKNISFYNEFSDAGWAYRFVINKGVDFHNELLENFEM